MDITEGYIHITVKKGFNVTDGPILLTVNGHGWKINYLTVTYVWNGEQWYPDLAGAKGFGYALKKDGNVGARRHSQGLRRDNLDPFVGWIHAQRPRFNPDGEN